VRGLSGNWQSYRDGESMGNPGSDKSVRVNAGHAEDEKIIVADLQQAYDGR